MDTLDAGLYTPESVQAFIDALNAANVIDRLISFENQDQVDTVAANLYSAMYGLVFLLPPGIAPVPDSTQDFYGNPITPVVDKTRKYVYGLSAGGLVGDIYNAVGGDRYVSPTSFGANRTKSESSLKARSGDLHRCRPEISTGTATSMTATAV